MDNRRKCQVVSVSFTELGQSALIKNDTWLAVGVARSSGFVDQVAGGFSAMVRALLEDILFGPLGLSTVGLPLPLGDRPVMVHAALKHILADGDGFRCVFNWRGASSLKPCLVHHNVLKKVLQTYCGSRKGVVAMGCFLPITNVLCAFCNIFARILALSSAATTVKSQSTDWMLSAHGLTLRSTR